jgi:hypothetical protein
VSAATSEEVERLMLASAGPRRASAAYGNAPAMVGGLVPGPVSVCAVPIDGDPERDPQLARRLEEQADQLPASCQTYEVQAAPEQQVMTMQVRADQLGLR